MGRKRKLKIDFKFGVGSYLKAVKLSFLRPNFYISEAIKQQKTQPALIFFFTNLSIGFLVNLIYRIILSRDAGLLFFSISENLVFVPFIILGLFFLASLFFLLAKSMGGVGSYKQSLVGLCYSTPPVILFWIPVVNFIACFYIIFLIGLNFKYIHKLSNLKTAVLIGLPSLILLLLAVMFGVMYVFLGIINSLWS